LWQLFFKHPPPSDHLKFKHGFLLTSQLLQQKQKEIAAPPEKERASKFTTIVVDLQMKGRQTAPEHILLLFSTLVPRTPFPLKVPRTPFQTKSANHYAAAKTRLNCRTNISTNYMI
jgi:hypothetical protein